MRCCCRAIAFLETDFYDRPYSGRPVAAVNKNKAKQADILISSVKAMTIVKF